MGAMLILGGMLLMLQPLFHRSPTSSRSTFIGTSQALRRIFGVPRQPAPDQQERLRALDSEANGKG